MRRRIGSCNSVCFLDTPAIRRCSEGSSSAGALSADMAAMDPIGSGAGSESDIEVSFAVLRRIH